MSRNPKKDLFVLTIEQLYKIPVVKEFKFHPQRKWMIDYAIDPENSKIALEVEGGVYSKGRHIQPAGFLKDMEKYNQLSVHGWKLIRCTPKTLQSLDTLMMIKELLQMKSASQPQDALQTT